MRNQKMKPIATSGRNCIQAGGPAGSAAPAEAAERNETSEGDVMGLGELERGREDGKTARERGLWSSPADNGRA
jgi:hypothetical protein